MLQTEKREAKAEENSATATVLGCSEFEDTLDGERPTRQEHSSGARLRANRHKGRHAKPIIESAAHNGGKTDRHDWRCLAAVYTRADGDEHGDDMMVWAEGVSTRTNNPKCGGKLSRLRGG